MPLVVVIIFRSSISFYVRDKAQEEQRWHWLSASAIVSVVAEFLCWVVFTMWCYNAVADVGLGTARTELPRVDTDVHRVEEPKEQKSNT